MKTNRRRFLSLLGVSTAAGPLAVKAAAEAESAGLMNVVTTGLGAGYYGIGQPAESATQVGGYVSYEDRVIGVADYIKMFGVPKSIEETYRLNTHVAALDPDIACKRSWSMCVKIQEQRQRNYQRQIEQLTQRGVHQRAFKTIKNVLGFDWPW